MNSRGWRRRNTPGEYGESSALFIPIGDLREDIRQLLGEDSPVGRPSLEPHLNGQPLRICGVPLDFNMKGDKQGERGHSKPVQDFLTGLHSWGQPCLYLVLGDSKKVKVYMSLPCKDNSHVDKLLRGTFPGISVAETPAPSLAAAIGNLPYCAAMQGVPSSREGEGKLDRLLRGLLGNRWAYLVLAQPVGSQVVASTMENLSMEAQRVKNTYLRLSTAEHDNNPLARYYLDLIEAAIDNYRTGRIQGCWQTKVFLLTDSEEVLDCGMALLASVFCGDKSAPNPVRLYPCVGNQPSITTSTVLNTTQLGLLMQLPTEEFPGYQVRPMTSFAVALPENTPRKPVAVGKVLNRGIPTEEWLEIELKDLTKHALVTGVTGSGKTETCHFLLDQLWREHGVPFLVIEPGKKEYRDLRYAAGHQDLKVFTLGDEQEAPFRLNPFEIPDGVNPQTHIDFLRSLFNASFAGLYPPMPYLLEEALYQVYIGRGWDLVGSNTGEKSSPTLSDFCAELEGIVQHCGYDPEITQNVGTALRIRLNSLRIGAKGLMLNTAASIPFSEILEKPTVLEMASIADAEVIAFLMGLILIRLCEHLSQRKRDTGLKHITLIEEAHRLLAAGLQNYGNVEVSNVRGQAVEAFCNMLAEVRALGEGFVIVDQSPTKLHPDAVKGTNLKLVHRLVAGDDRKAVAASANMNKDQGDSLATLNTGEAVVYAEGFSQPFLVMIPPFRDHAMTLGRNCGDDNLRTHMQRVFYSKYLRLIV